MVRIIDLFDGDYRFLSNFYPCEIEYEGQKFLSTEAAFQAAKVKGNTPEETRRLRKIFTQVNPGKAKRLGRQCKLRPDWEMVKDDVMYEIVKYKFTHHNHLKKLLLDTRTAVLIEGTTWHDNYWGNCTCERCKYTEGKNQLGKILMRVRSELNKDEQGKTTRV